MPGTVDEETGGSTNQAQTRLCKHRLLAKFLSKVQVENQKAKHPAYALGPEALRQMVVKTWTGAPLSRRPCLVMPRLVRTERNRLGLVVSKGCAGHRQADGVRKSRRGF